MDSHSKNLRGATFETIFKDKGIASSGPISKGTKGLSKGELELALTVVLVDIASADENFEPAEYEVISSGLRRLFGTTKDQVKILVNQSKQILDSLRGTSHYTDQLRENLSEADRKAVRPALRSARHVDVPVAIEIPDGNAGPGRQDLAAVGQDARPVVEEEQRLVVRHPCK